MGVEQVLAVADALTMAGAVARVAKLGFSGLRVAMAEACAGGRCLKGSCFVAGTAVLTAAGVRAIESLEAGDLVVSRGESATESEWVPVEDTIREKCTEEVRKDGRWTCVTEPWAEPGTRICIEPSAELGAGIGRSR